MAEGGNGEPGTGNGERKTAVILSAAKDLAVVTLMARSFAALG